MQVHTLTLAQCRETIRVELRKKVSLSLDVPLSAKAIFPPPGHLTKIYNAKEGRALRRLLCKQEYMHLPLSGATEFWRWVAEEKLAGWLQTSELPPRCGPSMEVAVPPTVAVDAANPSNLSWLERAVVLTRVTLARLMGDPEVAILAPSAETIALAGRNVMQRHLTRRGLTMHTYRVILWVLCLRGRVVATPDLCPTVGGLDDATAELAFLQCAPEDQ
jgi:hypothetical protein